MKKVLALILTISLIMVNASMVFANGGTYIESIFFTDMPLDTNLNDMTKLSDKDFASGAVVVNADKNLAMGKDFYIDAVFGGDIVAVESLVVGCDTGLLNQQNITNITIDYLANGDVWTTAGDYTLDYKGTQKATILLNSKILASKIRIFITDAKRVYNNFRIEELQVYGNYTGEKVSKIAPNSQVSVDFGYDTNFQVQNLSDGNYNSELVSLGVATPASPATVTYDFGANTYNLTSMDLVGRYFPQAGITSMDVSYKLNDIWTDVGTFNVNKTSQYSTYGFNIANFPLNGINANAIKLKITASKTEWGHFRFADVVFNGECVSSAIIGTKLKALNVIPMAVEGDPEVDKLADSSNTTGGIAMLMSKTLPFDDNCYIDTIYEGKIVKVNSVLIGTNIDFILKQGIKTVSFGYVDATGALVKANGTYTITPDATGNSIINLKAPITTSKLRMYIKDAAREWDNFRIDELTTYGNDTGLKSSTIATKATVSLNYQHNTKDSLTNLIDGDYRSEVLNVEGTAKPSPQNPAIVALDLDGFYKLSSLDLVQMYAPIAGVKSLNVEYKNLGVWKPLKTVNFNRGVGASTYKYAFDNIPLNIQTNGIRLVITDVNYNWNHFRLGEIVLYGDSIADPNEIKGTLLNATFQTAIPEFEGNSWKIGNLKNGTEDPYIVKIGATEELTKSHFIDVIFDGEIATVNNLVFACNTGLAKDQSITKFKISYIEDSSNRWIDSDTQYGINLKSDREFTPVALEKPIKTSKIRIYITDANRTYGTVRIGEIQAYGSFTGKRVSEIAQKSQITSNVSTFVDVNAIKDGSFPSEIIVKKSDFTISPQNPAVFEYTFDKAYDLSTMDIVSKLGKDAGLSNVTIEYKSNGAYVPLNTFEIPATQIPSTDGYVFDSIPLNITTDGIKISANNSRYSWDHFRVSDFVFHKKINYNQISYTKANNTINAKVIPSENATLIIAQYKSNALVSTILENVTDEQGILNASINDDATSTFKIMLLTDSLKPLSNYVPVQ